MTTIAILAALLAAAPAETVPAPSERGPRIHVITDLEGVAGVERWEQTRVDGPLKRQAMELLTDEINAVVDGIIDAAPGAVIDVWDGHGNGGIVRERFSPKANYFREGNSKKALAEGDYDAVFFVGQHAMAGTPLAPLAHTYSSRSIAYYKLNGVFVGEFGARTLLAGAHDVPVVFISGDDKAVLEARVWVPGIVGVAVKEGLGIERARSLSHEESLKVLRAGAAEAIRRIGDISAVRMEGPYRLEIRYLEPRKPEPDREGRRTIDSRTIELEAKDLADLPI
ncbi:MAG: M55 family metallopeptidase [Planctomycetes bacterium]|nr:M55 family metallopeptidase [Planctomycetota bacterium]